MATGKADAIEIRQSCDTPDMQSSAPPRACLRVCAAGGDPFLLACKR
jgi:hypothetical protein